MSAPWLDGEIATLVRMSRAGCRAGAIAMTLGRSVNEVWGKAHALACPPSRLLDEVSSFLAAHGLAADWFGLLVAGDERLVEAIRAGRVSDALAARVRGWMTRVELGEVAIPRRPTMPKRAETSTLRMPPGPAAKVQDQQQARRM
jgi:hypothetical protein